MVEDQPKVRLLAEISEIKDAFYSFLTASKIAELIRRDQVSLRTLREPVQNTIFTTESETVVPVMGEHSTSSSDPELASSVYGEFDSRFEAAEQYHCRTPALSAVNETLRDSLFEYPSDDMGVPDSVQVFSVNILSPAPKITPDPPKPLCPARIRGRWSLGIYHVHMNETV